MILFLIVLSSLELRDPIVHERYDGPSFSSSELACLELSDATVYTPDDGLPRLELSESIAPPRALHTSRNFENKNRNWRKIHNFGYFGNLLCTPHCLCTPHRASFGDAKTQTQWHFFDLKRMHLVFFLFVANRCENRTSNV